MTNINLNFNGGWMLIVSDYNTQSVNIYSIKDEDYIDCESTDDNKTFDMYKLLRKLGHNEDGCLYMWVHQDLQIKLP